MEAVAAAASQVRGGCSHAVTRSSTRGREGGSHAACVGCAQAAKAAATAKRNATAAGLENDWERASSRLRTDPAAAGGAAAAAAGDAEAPPAEEIDLGEAVLTTRDVPVGVFGSSGADAAGGGGGGGALARLKARQTAQ